MEKVGPPRPSSILFGVALFMALTAIGISNGGGDEIVRMFSAIFAAIFAGFALGAAITSRDAGR